MNYYPQKISLVTGVSSGIGKEIAIGLAQAGLHVIMVCRDLQRGEAALAEAKRRSASQSVDLLIADLSSQQDIINLVKIIEETYPSLYILINNAGVVLPQKTFSENGID